MQEPHLGLQECREMFWHVSRRMVESKDRLTRADQAIGDGDHGVGMARGFEAVREALQKQEFSGIDELIGVIGTTLLMSVGGAAGAIFGTFFIEAAKGLDSNDFFDSQTLSQTLTGGLEGVKRRGNALVGDKTLVDALEPAALRSQGMDACSLEKAFSAAVAAARRGMESTKEMVARVGKATTLGKRSLGYPDPGAVSMYLILKFMLEYVMSRGAS
jgi:dihydroxyacetone kinase-like protein